MVSDALNTEAVSAFYLSQEWMGLMERALPAWEQAQAEAKKLLGDDGLRLLDDAIGRVKSARAGA